MNEEFPKVDVKMSGVLEKFEGDPAPENLVEKVFIEDDKVVKTEYYEKGELVSTTGGE